MFIYVVVALGIILGLVALSVKQRTPAILTLSLIGIGLSLLSLVLSFAPDMDYNTSTGEYEHNEDATLNALQIISGIIGLILSLLAVAIKGAKK